MQLVHTLNAKAARTIILSVSGETGTGRRLVAEAIHFQLSRNGQPLVTVNMTTIPRELCRARAFWARERRFSWGGGTERGPTGSQWRHIISG